MRVSRRKLFFGLAGIAIVGHAAREYTLERRVYGAGSALPPEQALDRNGISYSIRFTPLSTEYLLAFDSLEARARAWDRFNSDPEWCAIRDSKSVKLREISVYPGGKIFEMSL